MSNSLASHWLAIFAACFGFSSAVQAAPSAQPSRAFRVVFRSSTACIDAREFATKLRSRTAGMRPAEANEPALLIHVELVPTSSGVRGQLQVEELDGSSTVRVIPASDCHEVLSAMALITALMVDPFALNAPAIGPMPPAPVSDRRVREPERGQEAPPALRPPFDFGLGQRVSGQTGVLPGFSWGVSAYADAGYRFSDVVRPTLRIAGIYSQTSVSKRDAEAAFTWASARLSFCPVRFQWLRRLEFRPCAFWDAGVLGAHGVGTDQPAPATSSFWSAAGIVFDAEARLVGPLTFSADLGAIFPLIRDRFYFDPDIPENTLHQVAAAGWLGGVGLGLRFY
jgi:hypothetical protein